MINNITGIILAGGESSRMGQDKAFILLSGKPMIEVLIDKMSEVFSDLMIVTNKPHLYEKYGIKTYEDIVKNMGPMGGIYTGLLTARKGYSFFFACDMPFLNSSLIRFMSENIKGYNAVVPQHNGRLEPLYAVYSRNCITAIENQLHKNNLKITDFLSLVKVRVITEQEIAMFDAERKCFTNINTPKDHQAML